MTRKLVSVFLLGALASAPITALAAPSSKANASLPTARSERALVFVLTTGLEDTQALTAVFRHAAAAAAQGRLREVAIIVYGRGVQAFDGRLKVRPAGLVEYIEEAKRQGVRVILCAQALDKMGVDRARIDPAPTDIVPNAMTTLVDYVVRDAAVVSY